MAFMDMFSRALPTEEQNTGEGTNEETNEPSVAETVGSNAGGASIDRARAMEIPAFAACVELVKGTVMSMPVKLYQRVGTEAKELPDDHRVMLLNGESGDTLTGPEILGAVVEDYYCSDNGGYIYIDRARYSNTIKSIRYVKSEEVAPLTTTYDPIFKTVYYGVAGRTYEPWRFVRVIRATRDGMLGRSLVSQNAQALSVAYETMMFEKSLVRRGGSKRGFLQSERSLGKKAMAKLKAAWARFYGDSDSNVVIMNKGLSFQEAASSSTEMQLNENKQTNAADICKLFNIPPSLLSGGGSTKDAANNDNKAYIRNCIMPLLSQLTASLNKALLLENEKAELFFAFDLTEFTKADPRERWEAWKIAKDGGFVMPDEVRAAENLPPLGLDYISMGLQDVLLDAEDKKLIVPNMGKVIDLDELPVSDVAPSGPDDANPEDAGGGEKNENTGN